MALFGILTENHAPALKFAQETNQRLKVNDYIKNPFTGEVKTFTTKNKLLHVVNIKPIYFNFSIFGWLYCFGIFYAFGFSWWLLPGVFIGVLGIFWLSPFYAFMYKKGLIKGEYMGSIKKIKHTEIIERILDGA